ncbi:Uncharacterised protein [Vibrio cholerae]|nr:Uncharacterised protein [Vibrio cholerae]CSC72010.1 Uncharacterised protein [Vibrio cholerae]CSH86751.1 Uncharacterised protein [Vibrio cholerae]
MGLAIKRKPLDSIPSKISGLRSALMITPAKQSPKRKRHCCSTSSPVRPLSKR